MLENLTDKLQSVVKTIRGQARFTEENISDAMREVRIALIEADVAIPVVKYFIDKVKEKALGAEVLKSVSPGQAIIKIVQDELTSLMGSDNAELNIATKPPAIILMAGLQGSGKTTTAAKLAKILKEEKKKVLLVSADVYRPAAIEQLKTLADSFMESVKKDGGVYDYRNIMDGTNNTNEVIDNNMGILDTFVEPVKGLEILVSRVTILNTGEIATGNFA